MSENLTPFDRIQALREQSGLSQNALCVAAGLNKDALANAKRHDKRLDLSTIEAFATYFNVPVAQLLGETPAAAPSGEVTAPHNRIKPSPRNPRKRFDPNAIDELATSVATKGILQPILVRHANQPGNRPLDGATPDDFEIIAGERRWRAAARCIELGLQPAHWEIPIKLRDCSDREMLEIALTENIQRNDMTPLEEGEAFAQLIDEDATTEEIAKVQGKTMRYVQQRLNLVEKLTLAAKHALAEGVITFSHARVLTTLPPARQAKVLPNIKEGMSAAEVRELALGNLFPVDRALFDLAQYTGIIIEDEEGARFFDNGTEFIRLQKAEIETRRREYQAAGTPWVKVTGRDQPSSYHSWEYDTLNKHPGAGVVIDVGWDMAVKIYEHQVPKSNRGPAAQGTAVKAEPEPFTKTHLAHAHRRKTESLQEAIGQEPMMAMRLVCLALIGATSAVHIKGEGHESEDDVVARGPAAAVHAVLEQLNPATKKKWDISRQGVSAGGYYANLDEAEAWRILIDLEDTEILEFFANLVALRCGTFNGYQPQIGDNPVALAIAESLGLVGQEAQAGLVMKPEDLDGIRKDKLFQLAKLASVQDIKASDKTSALKDAFAGDKPHGYVLPTLRFGTKAALESAITKPFDTGRQLDLEQAIAAKDAPDSIADRVRKVLCLALDWDPTDPPPDGDSLNMLFDSQGAADVGTRLAEEFGLDRAPFVVNQEAWIGFTALGFATVGDLITFMEKRMAHVAAATDEPPAFLRRSAAE